MTTERKPLEELSDREIDALVAEKIMGIDLSIECDGYGGELPNSSDGWLCDKCAYIGYWGEDGTHELEPLFYTRSLNAAFEVVEKMKELSVKVIISIEIDGDNSVQCGDIIINEPLWSIPKMMCVAALMWKDADAELNKLKTKGVE